LRKENNKNKIRNLLPYNFNIDIKHGDFLYPFSSYINNSEIYYPSTKKGHNPSTQDVYESKIQNKLKTFLP